MARGWNGERIALLKELYEKGLSVLLIATQMGVSKSTIIGKVHRLAKTNHLTLRPDSPTQRSYFARKARKAQDAKVAAEKAAKAQKAEKIEPQRKARPWMPGDKPDAPKLHYVPFVPQEEMVSIPVKDRVKVAGLADNQCRWPIGDPKEADFHFCNQEKFPGKSYCAHHVRRAIQPIEPVRRPSPQFPPLRVVEKQSETV